MTIEKLKEYYEGVAREENDVIKTVDQDIWQIDKRNYLKCD